MITDIPKSIKKLYMRHIKK